MESILITGASGRLGGAIVAALTARTSAGGLRALVRTDAAARAVREHGVEARPGDYADPASLRAAFDGVDRLVFVSSPVLDPAVRIPQHRAVVTTAHEAGVGHVVYTSAFGAEHDPGHAATEALLGELFGGAAATVLRNAFYTEPFVERALAEARSGALTSAAGGGALATASRADLAEAAASAVLRPPARRVHELRGPAWTYDDLAAALARTLGHPVRHVAVDAEAVGPFGPLHALAARGVLGAESGDLAALLGRPPRGIAEVVRELAG